MIDLAVAKSAVDLFKELLGLIDKRKADRRAMFERTFKPLYEHLEPAAAEYYAVMREVAVRLEEPAPDYAAVLKGLEAKRGAIVMARNGIVGQAAACIARYRQSGDPDDVAVANELEGVLVRDAACRFHRYRDTLAGKDEFDTLVLQFCTSIHLYFRDRGGNGLMGWFDDPERFQNVVQRFSDNRWWSVSSPGMTLMTSLIDDLRLAAHVSGWLDERAREEDLAHLRRRADDGLIGLERAWQTVSEDYGALKLHCGA